MEEEIELLEKYGQHHIIDFMNTLTKQERDKIKEQVLNIDFNKLINLYNEANQERKIEDKDIDIIEFADEERLEEKEEIIKTGEQIIKQGKYALVTLAGGQGTRLGHNGPKGTYKIKLVTGEKYLFEILADNLKKANSKYNVTIPWYIMTSNENNKATIDFLEEHKYFGYNDKYIKIFKQFDLPLIDKQGKLLIGKDNKIKEAAEGNGGVYKSMKENGIIEDMKTKGVQWVFIGGIDNILLNPIDPVLLGLTIKQNNVIASKSIVKTNPEEKVGVFCRLNKKPQVIEYIELPSDLANRTNENGDLLFAEVNFISHLYNITAIEKFANIDLKYHTAIKKTNYIDKAGNYIEPEQPNVYKFEAFIFDAFKQYSDMTILRVKRENEFAPIKNKEGIDSPETARKLYDDFYKRTNNIN